MRRRLLGLAGLRTRLVVALVLTSAATLLVVALTLLSPLEGQLRSEQRQVLRGQASTYVQRLERAKRHGAERQEEIADALHERAAARVVILGDGRSIVDTDATRRLPAPPLPLAGEDAIVLSLPARVGGRTEQVLVAKQLAAIPIAVRVVRHSLLVAGLIGLALAALLGMIVAQRLLRRLAALTRATHRLAQGEPVELPVDRRADEIGDLTSSFSLMQERLGRQEEARQTFVSTASHELRTPLASLAMMLELAESDLSPDASAPLNTERAREQVRRAQEQVRRLTGLARDLLDLSRLDADLELRREAVDIAAIARSVAAEFSARADEVGSSLGVACADSAWSVADPGAVAQIARILVDNALRFGPHGGRVELGCARAEDGRVALAVSDEGAGVSRQDARRIFTRFSRGENTGDTAGFGLGLAIGRELAERMGGSLDLDADARLTRFVLALPAAPAAPAADAHGGEPAGESTLADDRDVPTDPSAAALDTTEAHRST